jgi:hypothetical protein
MGLKPRLALALLVAALLAVAPASAAPVAPASLAVTDLASEPEVFDPQFNWAAVTGAKGYELEINSTNYWSSSSKVCCDNISFTVKMTTYGTSYSPPVVLPNNNQYFWRVRGVDASGNAGPWTAGPPFEKTFAVTVPSVPNLRLVDRNLDVLMPGSTTDTPIVLWDPVPGASGYVAEVTPFASGACNWSAPGSVRWVEKDTSTTGWTPLGWSRGINADPLSIENNPPSDDLITHLDAGQDYCVRVRPVDRASTTNGPVVLGTWTYLPGNNVVAFNWSGPPAVGPCSPCEMAASDYLRPLSGATVGSMPVFTWNSVAGAQSYFVVVARDPSFTNIVDYAYTRVAAYAPRKSTLSKGYPDETSNYYWVVLPATDANGSGVSADASSSESQPFMKQATSPSLLGPLGGTLVTTPATVFHWTSVFGARRYRVQVSDDPTFANVISEGSVTQNGAVTDSTAYTSNTAYPANAALYWRVQAEAEDGQNFVGLRWSSTGTFQKQATSGGTTGGTQKFRLSATGYPVRNRYRTITIYVKNYTTVAPVAGAVVRVSGAGVPVKSRLTGSGGAAKFYLKATRYPGKLTFRVSKTGYTTAYLYRSVRRA